MVLKEEKARPDCELSFVFVDDKFIKPLNKKYLNANHPTDVLSFNFPYFSKEKIKFLGEIIISCETVKRNASIYGNTPNNELIFCVIHGILHLLGYGDYTKRSKDVMFKKQYKILERFRGC